MAIIGTFTKQENGGYTGTIQTLTTNVHVTFEPAAKRGDKSPDYRITCGLADHGAAWKHTGEHGEYLAVQLDDPSFGASVNCRLVKTGVEKGYNLIWERPRRRS
jgi:uncharacterized protein (DUF736 family)